MGGIIYDGAGHILILRKFFRCINEGVERKNPSGKKTLDGNIPLMWRLVGLHDHYQVHIAIFGRLSFSVRTEEEYLFRVQCLGDPVAKLVYVRKSQHVSLKFNLLSNLYLL